MAKFFIDRPIFAWVIAILIMMGGYLAITILPIAQYPPIASPEIKIKATYPGASGKTVEDTVTQVIEQQMKGLDNLLYMYSTSDSSGTAEIMFTFENGTDVDIAQVQVQNKLQLATPLLPAEVQAQGLKVTKSVKNFLLVLTLVSEDGSMDDAQIGDYLASYMQDPLTRLPGVGESELFGAQFAMRIWCDPIKLEQYKLNPSDIIQAVRDQNSQVTGGQVGAGPSLRGQQINLTINAGSRFETIEQFEDIILRTNPDGSLLYLKDVARMELNNELFTTLTRYNGKPSACIGFKLATGANALETADLIKAEVENMSQFFPPGLKVYYGYDTTPFVKISIGAVVHTLIEAIILVFLVMFLFLQNFRATLIPTIAVPVVLLGTFAVLAAFGYSINSLTMFGMVLAIGLLVDDAIVVVENVERLMMEEHLSPRDAARKSMDQITGALVGVALVIAAVFVPMAFMGGVTGVIFRQFSITIVTSMTLSVVVAIVLTPALCATMLKPHGVHQFEKRGPLSQLYRNTFGRFFNWFNKWFDRSCIRYESGVVKVVKSPIRSLAPFILGVVLIGFMFVRLPTGFLPDEDQGVLFGTVMMPPGATFERTQEILNMVSEHLLENEADTVKSALSVAGFSFSGYGQNTGFLFISLKDWDSRPKDHQKAHALAARTTQFFANLPEAYVFLFPPPSVIELGNATGFDFELIDRAGVGHEALTAARNQLLGMAAQDPRLVAVRPNGLEDVEQYELKVDLAKAGALSLKKGTINETISSYWGGYYINDFLDQGRTKKVYLQADAPFRMQTSNFDKYHIRNEKGEMVPFSSFVSISSSTGSPRLERFKGSPAMEILGEAVPGVSTGQAMAIMEEYASHLPEGISYDWTGTSFQEKRSGGQTMMLYGISLAVVFLCLAALYESWTIPLSVLLVVPTGIIGALVGMFARGMFNDVYFQIGLLTIIGLSAKNSILIVEFAKDLHEQGMGLLEATAQACRMRLRPILMTSLAFILGVVPLMIGSGAGSGGQNALGTAVVCGMITATGFGIFYTPLFFVLVTRLFTSKRKAAAPITPAVEGAEHAQP